MDRLWQRFSRERFSGLPLTLLSAALLLIVALLLAIVFAVTHKQPLGGLDIQIADILYAFRGPGLLNFFYFATFFGQFPVVLALSACLSLFFFVKRAYPFIILQWSVLILAEGITSIGKTIFQRARPDEIIRAISVTEFSFPSGHATAAAALFGFVAYILFRAYVSWKVRVPLIVATALIIAMVDLSRMYLGVHYLSDVLAGNLVGLGSLCLCIVGFELIVQRKKLVFSHVIKWWHIALFVVLGLTFALLYRIISPISKVAPDVVPEKVVAVADAPGIFAQGLVATSTSSVFGTNPSAINVALIASSTCLGDTNELADWKKVDWSTVDSIWNSIVPMLTHVQTSKPSRVPYFYSGRSNDFIFEKSLDTGSVFSHLRLWKTGYQTPEGSIYAGFIDRSEASNADPAAGLISDILKKDQGTKLDQSTSSIPIIRYNACH